MGEMLITARIYRLTTFSNCLSQLPKKLMCLGTKLSWLIEGIDFSLLLRLRPSTFGAMRNLVSLSKLNYQIHPRSCFSVACDLPTYEYKRKMAAEQLRSEAAAKANKTTTDPPSNIIEIDSDEEDDRIGPSSFMYNNDDDHLNASVALQTGAPAGDDQDEDKFKLVLRSALTSKDITLNVRSTTKCGAIVNAFLKKAGLTEKYPALSADGSSLQKKTKSKRGVAGSTINNVPKLSIDGDKVGNDIEIGDYDLEEGDMVEVVDL